ncbi:hypothetical protein ABZ636_30990 [Streptomyces sp. NPDC007251]|uniref:hypothetical protein n=1 Tax=Streptomyces sp. NPDC007251 TaxID=3154483 RepID=UPI0033E47153
MPVTFSDQDKLTSAAELADRVLSTLTAAMELLGKQAREEAGTAPGTAVAA